VRRARIIWAGAMRLAARLRLTGQMTVPRDMDDAALLAAARRGDERAFGVLLARHRPGLETMCGLMLDDPQRAEQALQDAVLTAWQERALPAPSVEMWLYRIALRACDEALGGER
jgi:RNA polymerase sigma-70 factor (ECF subfamily)